MLPFVARHGVVRFGNFDADLRAGELRKAGVRVKLHDQPFQVLAMLLDRPGELVTRDEIRKRLWEDDTIVDFDHGLNNAVARLREALGDSADTPRFIETLPRKGYRFVAPASLLESKPGQEATAVALPKGPKSRPKVFAQQWRALVTGAVAALGITIAVAVVMSHRKEQLQFTRSQAVAVLPFQNTSATKDFDFLRFGLADDLATRLSYFPELSIRPSATSNRYAGSDVDLQKAAREMGVGAIITGHFSVAEDDLEVTLEAVDAANNRVIWRDSWRGSARDLTGIQRQINARVQRELIAALGVNGRSSVPSNLSHDAEAYELYLRALSEGDPTNSGSSFSSSNKDAIRLLQRAVALDPGYSSAWAALGHRYYYDIGFEENGEAPRSHAKAALHRALALDPSRIDAATDLINIESEDGELNQAYDDITRLLRQRPDNGAVHLVYSYVLWYAGLLDESANECEKTRALDAGTTDLAACSSVFMGLGRYDRARDYLQLLSGSEFAEGGEAEILLREGKQAEAIQHLRSLPAVYGGPLLEPCLQGHPSRPGDRAAQKVRSVLMADNDPFPKYGLAAWDSLCGQAEFAFRELRRAIEQDYCAYPQMETDPLLAKVRAMPEFAEVRSLGIACQQQFLEHRKQQSTK
jgi:DNA-binding winged helix-turn-helix (wHTH) protein/TolB-like protein